jgi:hypothetical protein
MLRACGALDTGVPVGITGAIFEDTEDSNRRSDQTRAVKNTSEPGSIG